MTHFENSTTSPDVSTSLGHIARHCALAVASYLNVFTRHFGNEANDRLRSGYAVSMRRSAEHAEEFSNVESYVAANAGERGNPAPFLDLAPILNCAPKATHELSREHYPVAHASGAGTWCLSVDEVRAICRELDRLAGIDALVKAMEEGDK